MTPKARRIEAALRVDRITGGSADGHRRAVAVPPSGRHRHITPSAALDLEICAPVLLHALLGGVLGARRTLFAVRDRRHSVLGDTVGLEVIHGRPRPPIAERHVVLGGALLVAIA